jgi:aryl-alcohol dehydrogenase-like predicted oxidoreductase
MRLSTDDNRDDELALATVAAALASGVTVFDTARAYGRDSSELGHNERLLARAVHGYGAADTVRIVSKGGMTRAGRGWVPDGRAKAIRQDCEASLAALDGLPIDVYLLHAPDGHTPWGTSVRALARLVSDGLVRRIGLSNVNRAQLDQALALAPITAVELAVSVFDDSAVRGGLIERCDEAGIAVIAHSPLGGPNRAARAAGRDPALTEAAERHGASPAEVALAWLLGLSPNLVAIPGARRPATARSAARAGRLILDAGARAALDRRFRRPRPAPATGRLPARDEEVVVMVGIPGAGKTRAAAALEARGYQRLNRDERGGTLRALADELDRVLADADHHAPTGQRRVVLDNTYLTRAARSHVVDVAASHGVPVRSVWLDTPLAPAQVNLVIRLVDRFGHLPSPEELAAARREPGLLTPTAQMRALRQLEPPTTGEGFAAIERLPFTRAEPASFDRPAVFIAGSALELGDWHEAVAAGHPGSPHLVFDWRPGGDQGDLAALAAGLAASISGPVEDAVCPHPAGPPRCWCRPPLPGLPVAFALAHGAGLGRCIVVGTSPAHRTLANALGATLVLV